MASSSLPLQTDQTDEEFFDKLVDEDYRAAQSHPEPEDMVRDLSILSLGEVEDSGSASEVNTEKGSQNLNFSEASKSDSSIGVEFADVLSKGVAGGAKVGSVKEIQWSSFSVNSQQFGQGEFESDLFFGSGNDSFVDSQAFSEPKLALVENTAENIGSHIRFNKQEDAQVNSFSSEQTADITGVQNWENLYPGWKFDSITGQWYQEDGYDDTKDTQSDNFSLVSLNTHDNSETKVLNAYEKSESVILGAVNLHQTILENSSVSNSRKQVTQVYSPNMVFDPQYPEWYYDTITQMWYTLESYNQALHDSSNATQSSIATKLDTLGNTQNAIEGSASEISDALNLQQTNHPVLETISEESSVSNSKNEAPQGSIDYPPNMVFDPQFPEWYYDTIKQMWCTLESYAHAFHDSSNAAQVSLATDVNALSGSRIDDHPYDSPVQFGQYAMPDQPNQESNWNAAAIDFGKQNSWQEKTSQEGQWNASESGYGLPSMWQEQTNKENSKAFGSAYNQQKIQKPEFLVKNDDVSRFSNNGMTGSFYGSLENIGSNPAKQIDSINLEPVVRDYYGRSGMTSAQSFATTESMRLVNKPNLEHSLQGVNQPHLFNSNHATERSINYAQQSFQGAHLSYPQFSYTPNNERSTAGRPPHALVTFGFGGKVIVMKDTSFSSSSFVSGRQETVGGVMFIHSVADVVMAKADFLNSSAEGFGYFHALCQESFPGPLIGGNAASKDVNKWINDRITNSESSSMDLQNGSLLRLLLSLLKILCQHYGKLRSPYGLESLQEGSDGPESAVSKLFASAKRNDTPFEGFGSSMHCMKNPPSDESLRATATEVQNLLIFGRRKEALQRAQDGQLWGAAIVLAAQLGEQFYADTVKQMALRQFVCGSPLRTLCLLIAGQPAYVFSADSSSSGLSGTANGPYQTSEVLPNCMLDDWQENLAIVTSNRTKDDELVIIHLGDCLWKERGAVTAAHSCYLLAEANFEPYSDSARLCLIGADHWKNPRTYACPDSIQRTEIYEYSKVIGNSQFVLLPFQPYKLVYAYMLAEVGKVSDSLRYCQASMKMLKNSGRSPEVELWRTLLSSLEERLRGHQQGGYGANLAPTKVVGKFFKSIDRSIHRIIGAPPLPPMLQNTGDSRDTITVVQKVSSSQSAMAMTSLMTSSSVEAMNEWTGDGSKKAVHNRSISEPDFGRNTKQNSLNDGNSYGQSNASMSGGPSRFGRFGSQLFHKTIGWVSWSRHDRQAKLGESNKFYYDEKLKRWVEEGAELPVAEASLPPPPIAASFQNGASDYDVKNALKSNSLTSDAGKETKLNAPSEQGFGFPPVPPSQSQFSARNRVGVRSRYVDTFNKGGGSFSSNFQSPSAPSIKPFAGANLFVPSAPTNYENQADDPPARATVDETAVTDEPSTSSVQEPVFTRSALSSSSRQRFPSMDNLAPSRSFASGNGSISSTKSVGMELNSFVVSGTPHIQSCSTSSIQLDAGGSVMDDLHEVEL